MENKGLLVVISGFSGVGKGTVIQMVLDELPTLRFSISCTTRAPRAGEENGVNIKKLYPECVTIFVQPPSLEALKARLIGRGSESPESLERRLREIETESKDIPSYDYVVTNTVARTCADEIVAIIKSEHLRTDRAAAQNIFPTED